MNDYKEELRKEWYLEYSPSGRYIDDVIKHKKAIADWWIKKIDEIIKNKCQKEYIKE